MDRGRSRMGLPDRRMAADLDPMARLGWGHRVAGLVVDRIVAGRIVVDRTAAAGRTGPDHTVVDPVHADNRLAVEARRTRVAVVGSPAHSSVQAELRNLAAGRKELVRALLAVDIGCSLAVVGAGCSSGRRSRLDRKDLTSSKSGMNVWNCVS